jgi:hypothetical protein
MNSLTKNEFITGVQDSKNETITFEEERKQQ